MEPAFEAVVRADIAEPRARPEEVRLEGAEPRAEPVRAEEVLAAGLRGGSAFDGPAFDDPAPDDPAPSDPVPSDPAPSDPAPSDPARAAGTAEGPFAAAFGLPLAAGAFLTGTAAMPQVSQYPSWIVPSQRGRAHRRGPVAAVAAPGCPGAAAPAA